MWKPSQITKSIIYEARRKEVLFLLVLPRLQTRFVKYQPPISRILLRSGKFSLSHYIGGSGHTAFVFTTSVLLLRDHPYIIITNTNLVALGSITHSCSFPITGNKQGRDPTSKWYMVEVTGPHVDWPMRRGMTLLTSNELEELVAFYARSSNKWKSINQIILYLHKLLGP